MDKFYVLFYRTKFGRVGALPTHFDSAENALNEGAVLMEKESWIDYGYTSVMAPVLRTSRREKV